jgi:hypothetical protein
MRLLIAQCTKHDAVPQQSKHELQEAPASFFPPHAKYNIENSSMILENEQKRNNKISMFHLSKHAILQKKLFYKMPLLFFLTNMM